MKAKLVSKVLLVAAGSVTLVGCVDLGVDALARRGDVDVLAVDGDGGVDALDVPASGLGAAVVESDLVLFEASAVGPQSALCPSGSLPAAAVAKHTGAAVWMVAGVGRLLPRSMFDPLVHRAIGELDPWEAPEELVPLELVDAVVGPAGAEPVAAAVARTDCPVCPELFRSAV